MLIILFYFIANILLSMYVERIRRSTAVVAHAVLFVITFVCLLFCSGVPFFKEIMLSVFEEDNYNNLMNKLCISNIPVMLPFAVVEMIVLLQMLFTTVFFAVQAVQELLRGKAKKYEILLAEEQNKCVGVAAPFVNRKIYSINSVLLC